jgi:hypothetical protein
MVITKQRLQRKFCGMFLRILPISEPESISLLLKKKNPLKYGTIKQLKIHIPPPYIYIYIFWHSENKQFNFSFFNSAFYTHLNPPASFFCDTSNLQFRYNPPDSFTEYNIGQQL